MMKTTRRMMKSSAFESDSTATESMLDEDFETTDPMMFDVSLMKITTGLRQAAEGFEELCKMLPNVPVTDKPKIRGDSTTISHTLIQSHGASTPKCWRGESGGHSTV